MKQGLLLLTILMVLVGVVIYLAHRNNLSVGHYLKLTFLGLPSDKSHGVQTLKDSQGLEESD